MSSAVTMPAPPPVRNNDQLAEHYADGPVGVNFLNGNLHITFATLRADHSLVPASQYRQVTLRLVIPLVGAIDLQNTIGGIVSTLQTQGVVRPVMSGSPTKQ
jgi:hypothetical protein